MAARGETREKHIKDARRPEQTEVVRSAQKTEDGSL